MRDLFVIYFCLRAVVVAASAQGTAEQRCGDCLDHKNFRCHWQRRHRLCVIYEFMPCCLRAAAVAIRARHREEGARFEARTLRVKHLMMRMAGVIWRATMAGFGSFARSQRGPPQALAPPFTAAQRESTQALHISHVQAPRADQQSDGPRDHRHVRGNLKPNAIAGRIRLR